VAIQPIDLQTLYTQLDKIGRTQVQQQVAAQAERDAEISANKTKAERKLTTVQETDAGNELTGKVHERNGNGKQKGGESGDMSGDAPKKQEVANAADEKKTEEETPKEIIRDPALGSHIDISG